MLRRAALVLALSACAGAQRGDRPAMPVCARAIHPGVSTHALAWSGAGWGVALVESSTLYLREFALDGAPRGDRVALTEVPAINTRVALAWSRGSYYAATGPQRPGGPMMLLRATSAGTQGDAFVIEEPLTGDLDVVARPDVRARPAAFLFETAQGTSLSALSAESEPGPVRRCPAGVVPRAVRAWGAEFRAIAVEVDASTGEGRALDVVAFDVDGTLGWRSRVWTGEVNGRAHSFTVDEQGTVVTFSDREGGAWIAGVDHAGHIALRAARLERRARAPQVFSQTDIRGRRVGLQVIVSRSTEADDRLETWRLGPDGLLRDAHEITSSPAIDLRYGVADPWGGALVVFSREETTHGSARTGAGVYGFFARVCP